MNNIITSIGNPILNNELKKIKNINIIKNDIKYEKELLKEIENKKINYLIISDNKKSENEFINLLEKINNKKIKIIIILKNKNLEKELIKIKIFKLYYEENFNINKLIKDLNNSENNIKNEYLKSKVISVIGAPQTGKTFIISQLVQFIKNKKILIINCDFKFKDIQIIFNLKNTQNKKIIKIKNNIDLINLKNDKNKITMEKTFNKIKNNYDYIFIDNNFNFYYEMFLNKSDLILFIINPNIFNLNKSKINIEKIKKTQNNKKLKIIINKAKSTGIDTNIIKKIINYKEIIGKVNYSYFFNTIISKIFMKKEIKKIIKNI